MSSRSLDTLVPRLWKLPCCWSSWYQSAVQVFSVLSSSLYQEWQNTSKWCGTDQRSSCVCYWGHTGGQTRAHACCHTGRQAASQKTLWGLFGKGKLFPTIDLRVCTYVYLGICLCVSLCVCSSCVCAYAFVYVSLCMCLNAYDVYMHVSLCISLPPSSAFPALCECVYIFHVKVSVYVCLPLCMSACVYLYVYVCISVWLCLKLKSWSHECQVFYHWASSPALR